MGTSEYIMFVDETNKTNKSENFCLAGLIMKRFDYEKIIIPKVNKLKKKYFGDTNIILHYSKMKKPRNEYSFLNDQITRNNFYMDLMKIFRENTMTVLVVYFNKNHMKELYSECTISDYNVAFKFLIENFMHFLKENDGDGMIIVESRSFNENSNLQYTFNNYVYNGSELFSEKEVDRLKCLGFIVKNDNCVGLQMVDFIPSTIVRIVEKIPDKFSIQKTIGSKVYYANTKYQNMIGIKNMLGEENKQDEKDTSEKL